MKRSTFLKLITQAYIDGFEECLKPVDTATLNKLEGDPIAVIQKKVNRYGMQITSRYKEDLENG